MPRNPTARLSQVTCITTPGSTVDVVVTQRGIAVNPARADLKEKLVKAGLPVVDIAELKAIAEKITGTPKPIKLDESKVVAEILYRDGTVIDTIKKVITE